MSYTVSPYDMIFKDQTIVTNTNRLGMYSFVFSFSMDHMDPC